MTSAVIPLPHDLATDTVHGVHVQGDLVDAYNFKPSLEFLRTVKGAFPGPGTGQVDFSYSGTVVGSVTWSAHEVRATFPSKTAVYDFVASFVGPRTLPVTLPDLSVVRTSTTKSLSHPELCVVAFWEELIVRRHPTFWEGDRFTFPSGGLKLLVRKDQTSLLDHARAVAASMFVSMASRSLLPSITACTLADIETYIRSRPERWDRFALDALADMWSSCLDLGPVSDSARTPSSIYPERERSIQNVLSLLRRSKWTDTQARDTFFCFMKV